MSRSALARSRQPLKIIEFGVPEVGNGPWRYRPDNGQFIVVHVSARNVGREPVSFPVDSSQLVDARNRIFDGGFY